MRADTDSVWILDEETGQPVAVPLATISRAITLPSSAVVDVPPEGSSGRGRGSERGTEPVAESSAREEVHAGDCGFITLIRVSVHFQKCTTWRFNYGLGLSASYLRLAPLEPL